MSNDWNIDQVHLVPVTQIIPGDNHRKQFDRKRLQELATSIEEDGLTNPITVKHIGYVCAVCGETAVDAGICESCNSGLDRVRQYRIAAGERRFRAVSDILGRDTIPAFIRDMDAERERAVMAHENINRVNLNPIEEAEAYQEFIRDYGWSEDKTAQKCGTSLANVKARLRLLDLIPQAQDMLKRDQIPLGHADAMAGLPAGLQMEALKLLGKTDVSFVQFKQYLAQLETADQSAFDLTAFWTEQIQNGADKQQAMRARDAEIFTSDELPPVRGNRRDTAGDLIVRYMRDLHEGGHESEAAAVGNLLERLLSLRKVKNFRENPAFAID